MAKGVALYDVLYETEFGNVTIYNKSEMDILIMLILLLSVAFLVLLERKLLGGLQLRTGPVNVR